MALVLNQRPVPAHRPYPPGTPGAEGPAAPIFKVELPKVADDDRHFGGCRGVEHCYERQDQIGEGTYGEVYLARCKATGDQVALKKIRMENEKEGFPITAIREIKLLKQLNHENVIRLREIVRSQTHKVNNYRGSIYMVFDYMDHDLTGLMERTNYKLNVPQVKCYMKQLFNGLHACHKANILHRDLKASNLLIDNKGILKLADFGLARKWAPDAHAKLTNRVITLWYRPPELMLGQEVYGPEVDMWSVGCICAELLTGKPMFAGKDESEMLEKIFSVLGNPNEQNMPGCTRLPNYSVIRPVKKTPSGLEKHFKSMNKPQTKEAIHFLERLLNLDPRKRMTAYEGFEDKKWLWSYPPACQPHELPALPASHEMQMKKKRQAEREAQKNGLAGQQNADHPNKRARHGGPQAGPAGNHPQQGPRRGGPGPQAGQFTVPHPANFGPPAAIARPMLPGMAAGYQPTRPAAIPRPMAGPRDMGPGGGNYMAPPALPYPAQGGYGQNRFPNQPYPSGGAYPPANAYGGAGYPPAGPNAGGYPLPQQQQLLQQRTGPRQPAGPNFGRNVPRNNPARR